jgi:hypothetical protein
MASMLRSAACVEAMSAGTSIAVRGLSETKQATMRAPSSVGLVSTAIAPFYDLPEREAIRCFFSGDANVFARDLMSTSV